MAQSDINRSIELFGHNWHYHNCTRIKKTDQPQRVSKNKVGALLYVGGFSEHVQFSGFFIENQILPNVNISNITANWFAEQLTGITQTSASSVGNMVSLGFFILNLVGAIFPLILQAIAKRIGRVKTYIAALAFSAIGYFYIAYFSRLEIDFYIGMFLVGIGWSAVISIVFAIMSERVNPAKMSLYMGVFNLAVVLPQMMSNGVANVIKATGNHHLLYIFCGLLVTTSVIFWMFVKEPESSSVKENIPKGSH